MRGSLVHMPRSLRSNRTAWCLSHSRTKVALLIETSNAYARGVLQGVVSYIHENESWSFHLMEHGRGDDPPSWLAHWDGAGIIARIESRKIADAVVNSKV